MRRRGRNLLLSPLDWALIETWQERGIPLHVIVRGIETVFDSLDHQQQNTARKKTVKGLFYCKEEIEAQYAEWLARQVGKNGSSETAAAAAAAASSAAPEEDDAVVLDESLKTHLENVGRELQSVAQKSEGSLREVLKNVSRRLEELKLSQTDTETLENALEDLEKLIDAELLNTLKNKDLEKKIGCQLAAYKNKMESEVYRRTFDLMLLKELREQYGIPRLSLFYL